jgi:hypothetical protein
VLIFFKGALPMSEAAAIVVAAPVSAAATVAAAHISSRKGRKK